MHTRTPPTAPLVDDRYLLLDRIGRGGMASVFRAFDRIDRRCVAIKVQRSAEPADPSHPLSAEFDLWSRMQHPNVVRVYGMGSVHSGPLDHGTPYLVLECAGAPVGCPGPKPRRFSPSETERLGAQMLHAMAHVHDAGLVHRDVKPANILDAATAARTTYKLTDFGLAVERGRREPPGRLNGSLPYVAPESLLGAALDTRADLYALGITLFRLVTGRLPAASTDPRAILDWHLAGPAADPRTVDPRIPERLARFIVRLTQRDADRRPRDPHEALGALGLAPSAEQPAPATLEAALRVRLRLAFDATRLGASREIRLPVSRARPEDLACQLRTWAQIFGLGFHRLTGQDGAPPDPARFVMELLLELGDGVAQALRSYGLDRALPLSELGGQPFVDRCKPAPDGRSVEGVARFVLDRAHRKGLVILTDPSHRRCRTTARLIERLRRALTLRDPRPAGSRGLLLLVQ
jgi:hypothetical protein